MINNQKSVEMLQDMAESDENWQELSSAYWRTGDELRALDRTAEALLYYEKAVKCKENLYEKTGSVESLLDLIGSYRNICGVTAELKRMCEMLSYFEKIRKCEKDLYNKTGSEVSLRALLTSCNSLGQSMEELGLLNEALSYYAEALKYAGILYDKSREDGLRLLAVAYNNMGTVLCNQDRFQEAQECLKHAVEYTEKLSYKNPTQDMRVDLANHTRNLAMAFLGDKRFADALRHSRNALEIDNELNAKHPSDDAEEGVMKSMSVYAEVLLEDNQIEKAYEMYMVALRYCKNVCEKKGSFSNFRFYVKNLKGMYQCLHKRGEDIESIEYLSLAKDEAKKLYKRSGVEKDKKQLEELLSY